MDNFDIINTVPTDLTATPNRSFDLFVKLLPAATRLSAAPFYRLQVDSGIKFIELRRRLAAQTNIYADNQEWYLYELDENQQDNPDYIEDILATLDDEITVESLIDSEQLYHIPVGFLVEETSSLDELCVSMQSLIAQSHLGKTSHHTGSSLNLRMLFVVVGKEEKPSQQTVSQVVSSHVATNVGDDHFYVDDDDVDLVDAEMMYEQQKQLEQLHKLNQQEKNSAASQQQKASTSSSIDLTKHESVEELKAPDDDLFAPRTSRETRKRDDVEDDDDEIVVEDDDNFDVVDVHNDEDDLQFLSEESSTSTGRKKYNGLIPTSMPIDDELACTSAFVEEFSQRYGPVVPLFYIGTLDQALKDALFCQARDRKLFAIYLHSDSTIFTHIFCNKTLCDDNVIEYLSSNVVVWPWDVTHKQYEEAFYKLSSRALGQVGGGAASSNMSSTLRQMKDRLPLMLVITRSRGINEISAIIEGDCSNEMMMHRLMQAYELFSAQKEKDERDEATRDERERIKREQDAAYQASLESDKAKRQKQEEEQEKERERVRELENRKQTARQRLPDEPDASQSQTSSVSRIRFRLPSGEFIQRRFLINHKLQAIIDFITSHGYFTESYKLLSSWPRRDLTTESVDKTLEELKLFPQETLTLEERV